MSSCIMVLFLVYDVNNFISLYNPSKTFISGAISPDGCTFMHAEVDKNMLKKFDTDKNIKEYELGSKFVLID